MLSSHGTDEAHGGRAFFILTPLPGRIPSKNGIYRDYITRSYENGKTKTPYPVWLYGTAARETGTV
jgi:hypothetical protein